jgi:ornithine carbamoyltransferase
MHLKTLLDWSEDDVADVLSRGLEIKANPASVAHAFAGKTLILILEKTSTRTRASFEAGASRMGGHAMILDVKGTQLSKGARLQDEIRCLARYADVIAARVFDHASIRIMAEHSRVPVVNALCDRYHPCQALADLMTLREKLGTLEGKTLCYVGDGNNVCNSLIIAASRTGLNIRVACPEGYDPAPDAVEAGRKAGVLELERDPKAASRGSDAVYTDTWVSMGQEEEAEKRRGIFEPYRVTREILGDALFMHCLPLYRGEEVAEEIPELESSVIFDQAENRMHVQNAVLLKCIEAS